MFFEDKQQNSPFSVQAKRFFVPYMLLRRLNWYINKWSMKYGPSMGDWVIIFVITENTIPYVCTLSSLSTYCAMYTPAYHSTYVCINICKYVFTFCASFSLLPFPFLLFLFPPFLSFPLSLSLAFSLLPLSLFFLFLPLSSPSISLPLSLPLYFLFPIFSPMSV